MLATIFDDTGTKLLMILTAAIDGARLANLFENLDRLDRFSPIFSDLISTSTVMSLIGALKQIESVSLIGALKHFKTD